MHLETRIMPYRAVMELADDMNSPTLTRCERHIVTSDMAAPEVTPGTNASDGNHLAGEAVTCGTCRQSWCGRCDPTPAAGCHYCTGRGHSTSPIGDDQ